jgi:hypothetical protein
LSSDVLSSPEPASHLYASSLCLDALQPRLAFNLIIRRRDESIPFCTAAARRPRLVVRHRNHRRAFPLFSRARAFSCIGQTIGLAVAFGHISTTYSRRRRRWNREADGRNANLICVDAVRIIVRVGDGARRRVRNGHNAIPRATDDDGISRRHGTRTSGERTTRSRRTKQCLRTPSRAVRSADIVEQSSVKVETFAGHARDRADGRTDGRMRENAIGNVGRAYRAS